MNVQKVLFASLGLALSAAACDPPAPAGPPSPPAATTMAPATMPPIAKTAAPPEGPKADTPTGAKPTPAPEPASPPVAATFKNTFEKSFPVFKHCYDEAFLKDGKLKGQVLVSLLVRPDGVPVDIKDAGSTISDKAMIDCVVMEINKIRFPGFEGKAVTYSQPLEFHR